MFKKISYFIVLLGLLSIFVGSAPVYGVRDDKSLTIKDKIDGRTHSASKGSMPRYREGEVLVKFRETVSSQFARVKASSRSMSVAREFKHLSKKKGKHYMLLRSQKKTTEEMIAELRKDPDVEFAEPNYLYSVEATPNDPRYPELWGMSKISAESVWDTFTDSSAVVIAVIDSGVDYTHEDLVGNMWVNPGEDLNSNGIVDVTDYDGLDNDGNGYIDDLNGINTIEGSGDPMDDGGHGTHVAGTIGAQGNNTTGVAGVNWDARLIACKFLDADGRGFTSEAVECLDYLYNLKITSGVPIVVTNNSWGGGGFSQTLYDAIQAQRDAGILFVASAGNSGSDNDTYPHYPSDFKLENIISVAATDRFDERAGFSNFGLTSVDLAAPGVDVLSSVPPLPATLTYDGGPTSYKLVYFSFGFEGVNNNTGTSTREDILGDVLTFFGFPPPPSAEKILIVDDDEGGNSYIFTNGNYEAFYTNTLDALGYTAGTTYDVHTVGLSPNYSTGNPSCVNGPSNTTMSAYDLVIWFTGDDFLCTLTPTDQQQLSTFLNNGGNLFITGQDIGFDLVALGSGPSFYSNYLKARYISDDFPSSSLNGVGAFGGRKIDVSFSGDGAGNQYFIDTIGALTGGSLGFESVLYEDYNGTSMAAPHVTGAVALVAAQHSSEGWRCLVNRILKGVDPLAGLDGKVATGGRLNVFNAIQGSTTPQDISVTPASVSFGTVFFGLSSSRTVTIYNNGSDPSGLTVGPIEITGGDSSQFTVSTGTCPDLTSSTINACESCTINVTFAPGSAGAKNADLSIESDDPDNPLDIIPLSGSGLVVSSGGGGGGCFIATAAYGSSLADEVTVLREFRDSYLLTNPMGRAFVKVYYDFSPPVADFIAHHEPTRKAVRIVLTPIVYMVKFPFVIVIMIVIGGLVIYRKRTKPTETVNI